MSVHLGVLGGMFDPVHLAHVAVARKACDTLQLDRVHIIPCHVPAHRQQAIASGEHRLAMVRLAVADDPKLIADDRELRRPQVSYTVDTLESLRRDFPHATLVCIMGRDSFAGLTSWHRWESLLELAHLCIAARGIAAHAHAGKQGSASPNDMQGLDLRLAQLLTEHQTTEPSALHTSRAGCIYWMDDLALPHSSTAVRASLATETGITGIADPVLQYIRQYQLYS